MARKKESDTDKIIRILKAAQSVGAVTDKYKDRVSKVTGSSSSSNDSATGQFNGSGTPYGASGRGEVVLSDKDQEKVEEGYASGVPSSVMGDYLRGGYTPPPKLSAAESIGLAKEFGLQGMADEEFTGMTRANACSFAQALKNKKSGQVSANTSFGYNPKSISGFKEKYKDLQFSIDSNNNLAWNTPTGKKSDNDALIKSFEKDFAGLFNTPQEFQSAMQNPEFQNTIKQYEQQGGSPAGIEANIGQQMTPEGNYQSVGDYISNMNSPAQEQALQSLIPELKVAQDEISFEQSIPEQYRDYYWGTEDQVGFQEQKLAIAEEKIKLLERQEKADIKNTKAQANLMKEKSDFEADKAEASIEKNRLSAKNYLTGTLAKLGALKTTGAAPVAITNLEQKYQQQTQEMRTKYDLYNTQLSIDLDNQISQIELGTDEDILAIQEDLSNDEEKIFKEIFKLQNTAERNTFKVMGQFTTKFRTQTDKYQKEIKAAAEKNAKDMASIIGDYDISQFSEGQFFSKGKTEGVIMPDGSISKLNLTPSQIQEIEGADIRGEDAIRTFLSYPSSFRSKYIQDVQSGKTSRGMSIGTIQKEYDDWVKSNEKDIDKPKDLTSSQINNLQILSESKSNSEVEQYILSQNLEVSDPRFDKYLGR